nr:MULTISPECIES: helix-turn-helix domain-containing protein [unclassified Pannonibacter]
MTRSALPRRCPTEAAKLLGLGRSTVYRELRRLGIQRTA